VSAGAPLRSRTLDHGTEYTSDIEGLRLQHGTELDSPRPSKLVDNGFIEPFNSGLDAERINAHQFNQL
jgi:hypothetical protein